MAFFKITTKTDTTPKYRLVEAATKAQALAHVANGVFTVETCKQKDIADAFQNLGIKSVEKAGNGNE